jgi:hypothetical protein
MATPRPKTVIFYEELCYLERICFFLLFSTIFTIICLALGLYVLLLIHKELEDCFTLLHNLVAAVALMKGMVVLLHRVTFEQYY